MKQHNKPNVITHKRS